MGEGDFFSNFSVPLIDFVSSLLWLAEFWVVGLVLRGRFIPRFGGPSTLFKVPCIDYNKREKKKKYKTNIDVYSCTDKMQRPSESKVFIYFFVILLSDHILNLKKHD